MIKTFLKNKKIINRFFCFLPFVLFLYIAVTAVFETIKGQGSNGWIETSGTIISVKRISTHIVMPGNPRQYGREDPVRDYSIGGRTIRYAYTVKGRVYHSDRISFKGSGARIYSIVEDTYSPGRRVPVFYDPQHPGQAVLEKGADLFSFFDNAAGYFSLITAFVFMTIFATGAVSGRILKKKANNNSK